MCRSADGTGFSRTSTSTRERYGELLPSPTSIRLIRLIDDDATARISLELIAVELSEAPAFDALSYTWRDPSSEYMEIPVPADLPKGVYYDDKPIRILPNLASALQMLKSATVAASGKQRQDYIWVDAICINQGDVAERESQVAMMGAIFGRAELVIAWLGARGRIHRRRTLCHGADINSSIGEASGAALPLDITDVSSLCLQAGDSTDRAGKVARMASVYAAGLLLDGYWVIQEVAFARDLLFVCGQKTFPWEALRKTMRFKGLGVARLEHLRAFPSSSKVHSCPSEREQGSGIHFNLIAVKGGFLQADIYERTREMHVRGRVPTGGASVLERLIRYFQIL